MQAIPQLEIPSSLVHVGLFPIDMNYDTFLKGAILSPIMKIIHWSMLKRLIQK